MGTRGAGLDVRLGRKVVGVEHAGRRRLLRARALPIVGGMLMNVVVNLAEGTTAERNCAHQDEKG